MTIATRLAKGPSRAYRAIKRAVYESLGGNFEAALELLLNEHDVLEKVQHRNLASLAWSARTGAEELTLAFPWRNHGASP